MIDDLGLVWAVSRTQSRLVHLLCDVIVTLDCLWFDVLSLGFSLTFIERKSIDVPRHNRAFLNLVRSCNCVTWSILVKLLPLFDLWLGTATSNGFGATELAWHILSQVHVLGLKFRQLCVYIYSRIDALNIIHPLIGHSTLGPSSGFWSLSSLPLVILALNAIINKFWAIKL